MSDIFISYAREDRTSAERLAKALEDQGWSVWWDPEIPAGKTFDEVIEQAIESAKSIVAIWSKRSVKSRWVRTEAAEGADRGILVPVLIEDVRIPLAFKRIQASNLAEWDGMNSHLAFQKLVRDIAGILGPPPVAVAEEQHKAAAQAERLKEKEEAAKREATLDAKSKADEKKAKRAEEEARRKAEADKRRLAEQETQRKIEEARKSEEEAAKRKAEEAPASEIADSTHPTVPPGSSRSPLAKIAALGGIVVIAIFFVLIMLNEREPVQETYNDAKYDPLFKKYQEMPVVAVADDPDARRMGERLFVNYCATCHGSDARGARGFPNLRDNDWLYGRSPENIEQTILEGRSGIMPPWKDALGGDAAVADMTEYVFSLSGRNVDQAAAARGEEKFQTLCVACHGVDGTGNQALGAPNLTDNIWLHGGSRTQVMDSIAMGRNGVMPPHRDLLGEDKVHLLAAYVYSLSTGQEQLEE